MKKKRFTAEQIIGKLIEAEVLLDPFHLYLLHLSRFQ